MIPFTKIQTIGNDFVLIQAEDIRDHELSHVAQTLCDRGFGIGSDGLLVLDKADGKLWLRMFNADGSEDFCGNGLRCAGLWAFQRGLIGHHSETKHGSVLVPTTVDESGAVSITLPPASFEPDKVPILRSSSFIDDFVQGVRGTAVSTGSTHFVVFNQKIPDDETFFALGPSLENDPLFPERTSVMFVQAADKNTLNMRIWERGVGETLGCGTGASAAAVAWSRLDGANGDIVVRSKGGAVTVSLDSWAGPIRSTSRPVVTFTGQVCVDTQKSAQLVK